MVKSEVYILLCFGDVRTTTKAVYDRKVDSIVKDIISQNLTQCAFDFEALSTQPVEDFLLSVNPVLPQKEQSIRSDFFTYRLVRSDTGLPFYIGKGCGRRDRAHEENAKNHRKDCNHRVCNTIRKLWREGHRVIRERIAENITEASAFALEKFYVSLGAVYGWDLCNHTDGGEGVSGYRWTEEQRAMRREVVRREMALHPERHARFIASNIGRARTKEEQLKRNEIAARVWSDPELKQMQKERMEALWQDEEFRAKRKAALEDPEVRSRINANRRGKPNDGLAKTYPGFISPLGIIHEQVSNLHTFCKEHNLQVSCMCLVAQGKQYAHKGWTCYPPIEKPTKKPMPPKTAYTGFVGPDGQVYHVTTSLKDFCKEHDLTLGAMSSVNAGKWDSHKGWTKYQP